MSGSLLPRLVAAGNAGAARSTPGFKALMPTSFSSCLKNLAA